MRVDSGTAVARDMERVFSGMARPPLERPAGGAMRKAPARSGPGRLAWLAVAAAAIVVAILLLLWPTDPPPSLLPSPALQGVPARVEPAPAETIAPRPAPVAPSPAKTAAARPATPAPAPAPAETKTRTKPVQTAATKAEKAGAAKNTDKPRVAKDDATGHAPPASPVCQQASDRADCFYREVLAADRGLRRAYGRAADAEVPVAELYRARAAWKAALSRSRKQPLAAIGTLDRLAAELSAKASTAAAGAE